MDLLTTIIKNPGSKEIYTQTFYDMHYIPRNMSLYKRSDSFKTAVSAYSTYNHYISITYCYFFWRDGITISSPQYNNVQSTDRLNIVDLYNLITSGFIGRSHEGWLRELKEKRKPRPPPISGFWIPLKFDDLSLTDTNIRHHNITLVQFLQVCAIMLQGVLDARHRYTWPHLNTYAPNIEIMLDRKNIYGKNNFDVLYTLVTTYNPSVVANPIYITYWVADSNFICKSGELNKTGFELVKQLRDPIQGRLREDRATPDIYCGHSISSYQTAYMIMQPARPIRVIPYISSEPSDDAKFTIKVRDIEAFFDRYMRAASSSFNEAAAPKTHAGMGTSYETLKTLIKGNDQDSILFVNKTIIGDLYKDPKRKIDDFSIHKTVWATLGSAEFEPIDTSLYYTPDVAIPKVTGPNICRDTGETRDAALVAYYTPSTAGGALRKKKRSTRIQKKAKKYRGRRTRRASKGRIGA